MSPEEAQLFAAKFGGGDGAVDAAVRPSLDQAAAFRQRVLGSPTTQAAIDRGEHLVETLSDNPYTRNITGPLGAAVNYGTREATRALTGKSLEDYRPSRGAGGPDDLSQKAQQQLRTDDANAATALLPMNTPLANVEAAPTLEQAARAQRPGGGGGGGGGGSGLKAQYDAARAAGLRTLEQERDLTGQLGVDKAGRVMSVADLNEAEAARQQRLADDQQRIDAAAAAKHEAFIARNEDLANEIGKMKIDPNRMMRDADANTKMGVAIGGILGGGLAALNGGPNTSLARLDQMIDRDIRAQESEIDNKKASLSARNTVFGQMMQETGDRRLAAQQTRVMMLEAAKMKIQADSDRLGIPEVRTNAELATNQIQQKIDATKTGMAKEAYELFQRQAAAAAAAQRAAEERAWQRSMEVAKLGMERDKLEIEKQKALGLTGEDLSKQTQALGKELSDKDLAQGREAVENAKRRLASAKPDEGLPGIGLGADLREKIAGKPQGANILNPLAWGLHAAVGLSDQEKVSRGDWEKIKLSYQSQITGSGASDSERQMLSAAFEGAKSPAEQRNAIAQADAFFSRREAAIKAGFDPRAVATFEQRMQGYRPELPSSVQVKK